MSRSGPGRLIPRLAAFVARGFSPARTIFLLAASAGFFWAFNVSHLPFSNPELMRLGQGQGLLDLRFYYGGEEARTALEAYGEAGRALYRRFLAVDFIFPLVYGAGFAFLLTWLARAAWGKETPRLWINLLPLAVAFADYVEDLCILGLLYRFPQPALLLGGLAGMATLAKQVLTYSSLAALAWVAGASILARLRRQG